MKIVWTYHWVVTGILFAIAISLYIAGFTTGAGAIGILGFFVESAAWISFLFHPSPPPGGEVKE